MMRSARVMLHLPSPYGDRAVVLLLTRSEFNLHGVPFESSGAVANFLVSGDF